MPKRQCADSPVNDVAPFWKKTNGYTLHGGAGVTRWPKNGPFVQEQYYENIDGKAIWASASFEQSSSKERYQATARIYTNKHCFNFDGATVTVVFDDIHYDVTADHLDEIKGSAIGVQVERWKNDAFDRTIYSARAWEPPKVAIGQYEPDPKPHLFNLAVNKDFDYWVVFFIDGIVWADGSQFTQVNIKTTLRSGTWSPSGNIKLKKPGLPQL